MRIEIQQGQTYLVGGGERAHFQVEALYGETVQLRTVIVGDGTAADAAPGERVEHLPLATLRAQVAQRAEGDPLRAWYQDALTQVTRLQARREAALRAERRSRVAECPGHLPVEVAEGVYTGPVARPPYTEENRAAHGGISVTERCSRCGGERSRLVNGRHEELGTWGAP